MLWVRDRSGLAAGAPAAELRQALTGLGFPCESRLAPDLSPYEAVLSYTGSMFPSFLDEEAFGGPDHFLLDFSGAGIHLIAGTLRGLSYAVWELMERMGWLWPTPDTVREPGVQTWHFEPATERHAPALDYRICFAEQTEITPSFILWLSRHRINTLFPSNPAKFSDPEVQFPEESLQAANNLGLDLIVGGDCLLWLLAPLEMGEVLNWNSLTKKQLGKVTASTLESWREMGPCLPRLSVWPSGEDPSAVGTFLALLAKSEPGLLLETFFSTPLSQETAARTLFRAAPGWNGCESNKAEWEGKEVYVPACTNDCDSRLAHAVSPLLWRRQCELMAEATRAGAKGGCLSLCCLDAHSFLERAGFSLAVAASAMWHGPEFNCSPLARRLIHAQFEGGADSVESLIGDMERWVQGNPLSPFTEAHEILKNEAMRDKLDQRISEIEESPPSESCMELARSLSTLVGLFDLEECSDIHESRAIARTIWTNDRIDSWPAWLQASSPLAERLKSFL